MSREPAVVIIGGDAAGMSAASRIRREHPARSIVVFERSPHTSYSACGIPYYIGGLVARAGDLVARSPQMFREQYDIDARVRHEVVHIDTVRQEVTVRRLDEAAEFRFPYDQLLIASGASPVWPDVPGHDTGGIHGLSTLASGPIFFLSI